MVRRVFLLLSFALTFAAGPTLAQTAVPGAETNLAADRAKSAALMPEQRDQARKLFETAFGLLQSGDAQAAKLGFERGLAIDPANSTANLYMAEALRALGDSGQASNFYSRVIALDPNSADGLKAKVALGNLTSAPAGACGGGAKTPLLSSRAAAPLSAGEECLLKPKDTFKECTSCPWMVVVPAGTFTMGSPANERESTSDQHPQHMVTIGRQFAVGQYELTVDQWDACVADGGCNGFKPSDHGWGRGRQPVINVSWEDAKAYVAWLSQKTGMPYQLLSEAEYEYAARAGTTTIYPWGNDIGRNNANCNGCGSQWDGKKAAPVGAFAPNRFGLYDMVGNVGAWTEDCYHDSYIGAPTNGSAWTSGDCSHRVVRGGSWIYVPRALHSAFRGGYASDGRGLVNGFRVGRTLRTP